MSAIRHWSMLRIASSLTNFSFICISVLCIMRKKAPGPGEIESIVATVVLAHSSCFTVQTLLNGIYLIIFIVITIFLLQY